MNGPAADVTYDTVVHLRPMAQQASELLTVMSTAYPFCSGRFARGPLHGRAHGESSRDAEVLGPFSMVSHPPRGYTAAEPASQ